MLELWYISCQTYETAYAFATLEKFMWDCPGNIQFVTILPNLHADIQDFAKGYKVWWAKQNNLNKLGHFRICEPSCGNWPEYYVSINSCAQLFNTNALVLYERDWYVICKDWSLVHLGGTHVSFQVLYINNSENVKMSISLPVIDLCWSWKHVINLGLIEGGVSFFLGQVKVTNAGHLSNLTLGNLLLGLSIFCMLLFYSAFGVAGGSIYTKYLHITRLELP